MTCQNLGRNYSISACASVAIGLFFCQSAASQTLIEPQGHFVNIRSLRGAGIQSDAIDTSPSLSADGLEMFLLSKRGGDLEDIYRATRMSTNEDFGNVELLTEVSSTAGESGPDISHDGRELFFGSTRQGGFGDFDLYSAARPDRNSPFADLANLGETINTPFQERTPHIADDGNALFFSSDRPDGTGGLDIYMATRTATGEPFENVQNLGPIVNSEFQDSSPSLSADGLTLFFHSSRPHNDNFVNLWVATRATPESAFSNAVPIDEYLRGTVFSIDKPIFAESDPFISSDWPASGSKLYFAQWNAPDSSTLMESIWQRLGDFDLDNQFTNADIDELTDRITRGTRRIKFDINNDGMVDLEDRIAWVKDVANTYIGDANLDGEFNSSDFVQVFQAGEYEDGIDGNSTWATGDWNGDREFDSRDFVTAFKDAGFEKGPRPRSAMVPEPTPMWGAAMFVILTLLHRRQLEPTV